MPQGEGVDELLQLMNQGTVIRADGDELLDLVGKDRVGLPQDELDDVLVIHECLAVDGAVRLAVEGLDSGRGVGKSESVVVFVTSDGKVGLVEQAPQPLVAPVRVVGLVHVVQ